MTEGRCASGAPRSLAKPHLRDVVAYDPGPTVSELRRRYGADRLVKLNWNEDLFGLLPGVKEAVTAELVNAPLYPEQAYEDFRRAVASYAGTSLEQVVPAHGIQALVMAVVAVFVRPGDRVVIPVPTYGLYRQACEAAGAVVERVALRDDLGLDLDALAARAAGARAVFVCDPNNPTGALVDPLEWQRFLGRLDGGCLVVADEAYIDYVAPQRRADRLGDVAAGRPVVVLRTFSKLFGIAGLRLGYAIVHPTLRPLFDAVQEPFNVNRAALAGGMACLSDPGAPERRRREVVAARERLRSSLGALGLETVPSEANFVLTTTGGDDGPLVEGLIRRGFLIRAGSEFGLPGWARVTVAPPPVIDALCGAIAAELRRAP